ncbi:MAG: M1 family metallopeptidase [Psychroflexus sp.]|nr:M1 family metallopeptidase [Psychroflexus sp.]
MNRETLTVAFTTLLLVILSNTNAQITTDDETFTKADSLRGGLRPARNNFDILAYDLKVMIEPEKQFISGSNKINFKTKDLAQRMQLDLFKNMNIDSIIYKDQELTYERKHNAFFFDFPRSLEKGTKDSLRVYYSGKPQLAKNPPWDGGLVFDEDRKGRPHIGVAVQGTGASLWFPNKDHLKDEPEQVKISIIAPKEFKAVANGRKVGEMLVDNNFRKTTWQVTYPINNYNITFYLGHFAHFTGQYKDLELSYYPLDVNLPKAKKQFQQVQPMMQCFEEKFGFYPFKEDSYKLVESPYLGMEHQSAIAYGNAYRNGYRGVDISGTGIGSDFDFIIIHESAHEWFGNAISAQDIADLWIHEAFATYAEAVYVECQKGEQKAVEYLNGIRRNIRNDAPIIGQYGVNNEGSPDMYFKGANFLHTLRTVLNDDESWWRLIKGFATDHRYKTITTVDVIDYFQSYFDTDVQPIFDQYLRHEDLPVLLLKKENDRLEMKWQTDIDNFEMPIDVQTEQEMKRYHLEDHWQQINNYSSVDQLKKNIDQTNMYFEIEVLD